MDLHEAVECCDLAVVNRLLTTGANVNARDGSGQTPLRLAMTVPVAQALLAHGADINLADDSGLTPLHRAAAITSPRLMEVYLRHPCDVNRAAHNGQTPLITAVSFGNDHQAVQLLLKGARVNVRNKAGKTPLNQIQGQSVRDMLLFCGTLDELARDERLRPDAERLRGEAFALIGQVMFAGYEAPLALEVDGGNPRAATEAASRHQQEMGRRAREAGQRLGTLSVPPTLRPHLEAGIHALSQGQPVQPSFMGVPLTGEQQQRLAAILDQAQRPDAPPVPAASPPPASAPPVPIPQPPSPASMSPPEPYILRCPQCSTPHKVNTTHAGKKGRCSKCRAEFRIPPPVAPKPKPPLGTECIELPGGVKLELARLPAGTVQMGSPDSEPDRDKSEKRREERIEQPFLIGIYPVTQRQWEAITGSNPSEFRGPDLPVENISWEDAQAFCKQASACIGRTVKLPTEAQWEYACRAGTVTPFSTGATIGTTQANYNGDHVYGDGVKGENRQKTTPVGTFPPNPWGLYDMHGNVWEFCDDWYGGPNTPRMGCWMRGGAWITPPACCRSAARYGYGHFVRRRDFGFRVVVL